MYDVRQQCQNFKDHVYKIMVEKYEMNGECPGG
jgi:hypothetical protein